MRRLLFLMSLFITLISKAQQKIVSVQTPDVAKINQFIDFPVDKSTGVPEISIPIYTVQERDFSLPISINYHAGGIKVEEMASNVGLGWALIADGSVSRTIRSYPDELGYYQNYGPRPYVLPGYTLSDDGYYSINNSMNFSEDTEPDVFYFNLNGHSGKFIIDKNRNVQLIPEQDIKVETINIGHWKFTTPDGTQYFIGVADSYSVNYDGGSTQEFATSWRMYKIITPSSKIIEFEYIPEYSYYQKVTRHGSGPVTNWLTPNPYLAPYPQTVKGYKVSRIKSDLCTVDFIYKSENRQDYGNTSTASSNARALEKIKISSNGTGNVIKQFDLVTSYFLSDREGYYAAEDYLKKRLRLDEVKESDGNGNYLPAFRFSYNKYNKTLGNYLPNRLSLAQDAWGYYNGADGNVSLYPDLYDPNYQNVLLRDMPGNRTGNGNFINAFVLDEIVYPTGGLTRYEFEPIKNPWTNEVCGGLRVKRIMILPEDGRSSPIIKEYEYSSPIIIGGAPQYVAYIEQGDFNFSYPGGTAADYHNCNRYNPVTMEYIAMTDPVVQQSGITTAFVYHSKVTEKTSGNGWVETDFNVDDLGDETYDFLNSAYPTIGSSPLLITGKPVKEIFMDNSGKPQKEVNYYYEKYFRNIASNQDAYKVYTPFCAQRMKKYGVNTGFGFLTRKEVFDYSKTYDPASPDHHNDYIITTSEYEYGGIPSAVDMVLNNAVPLHHFITKETVSTSGGGSLLRRFKYPLDYKAEIGNVGNADSWDNSSKSIRELIGQYRVGSPVETITSRVKDNTEVIISGNLTEYNTLATPLNNALPVHTNLSVTNISAPVAFTNSFFSRINKSGSAYSFSKNNLYETRTIIPKYNEHGAPLEYRESNGIINAVMWGYKSVYPIAEIANCKSEDAFYTSFEEESGADISTADAKTGKKSKLNGFTKTLTNLTNGSYLLAYWQKNGGSWELKSGNATVSNGSYNINISGQVDEVRFYPVGALITTYAYEPLIGVTSSNDAGNKLTYYSYDNFNRLQNVRDLNGNILKQYEYWYNQSLNQSANWQPSGVTRCKPCPSNNNFGQQLQQIEMKDINSSSATFGQTFWIDGGISSACSLESDWQNTSDAPRCEVAPSGNNTGWLLQKQKNINPCSPAFNTFREIASQYNTTACPIPSVYYVKLLYENIQEVETSVMADIVVRFYYDAACTQEASTPDINVNYTVTVDCNGSSDDATDVMWGPSYTLTTLIISGVNPHTGVTCNVYYTLKPGNGYIIVP